MPVTEPQQLLLTLLSKLHKGTERAANVYQELSQAAQNLQIKEVLESRDFVQDKILSTLDQCFKLLNEKPMNGNGECLHEVLPADLRKELAEIQSLLLRNLYIMASALSLTLRSGIPAEITVLNRANVSLDRNRNERQKLSLLIEASSLIRKTSSEIKADLRRVREKRHSAEIPPDSSAQYATFRALSVL